MKQFLFEKKKSEKKIFPFQSMPNLNFANITIENS